MKKEPGREKRDPGLRKKELIEKPSNRPVTANPREKSRALRRYFESDRRSIPFEDTDISTAIIGRKAARLNHPTFVSSKGWLLISA
jgi:hypothetical protein